MGLDTNVGFDINMGFDTNGVQLKRIGPNNNLNKLKPLKPCKK